VATLKTDGVQHTENQPSQPLFENPCDWLGAAAAATAVNERRTGWMIPFMSRYKLSISKPSDHTHSNTKAAAQRTAKLISTET
jgi:hypothetical protein